MDIAPSFTPNAKRFFKLSELAGSRWPNVTEDDIFTWHDAEFWPPAYSPKQLKVLLGQLWPGSTLPENVFLVLEEAFFEQGNVDWLIQELQELWPGGSLPQGGEQELRKEWVVSYPPENLAEAVAEFWKDTVIVGLEVNIFTFWVFFREFRCLWIDDLAGKTVLTFLEKRRLEHPELFPYNLLSNVYMAPETAQVKGFSHNIDQKVSCTLFFDEQGEMQLPALFYEKHQRCFLDPLEIHKDALLLKASSVRLIEAMVPEITSPAFRCQGKTAFQVDVKPALTSVETSEPPVPLPPGSRILKTWGQVAEHADCSVSTAQRRFGNVVRYSEAGTVVTTTADIDAYTLSTATKKKKRK